MKRYKVIIGAKAAEDLAAAYRCIAADSPSHAARWLQRMYDSIETLETMPRRCPAAPESQGQLFDLRMLVLGEYLCVFTVNEDAREVRVVNFRHGAQQTPEL